MDHRQDNSCGHFARRGNCAGNLFCLRVQAVCWPPVCAPYSVPCPNLVTSTDFNARWSPLPAACDLDHYTPAGKCLGSEPSPVSQSVPVSLPLPVVMQPAPGPAPKERGNSTTSEAISNEGGIIESGRASQTSALAKSETAPRRRSKRKAVRL